MSSFGHHVGLIQNYKFKVLVSLIRKKVLRKCSTTCKALDDISDNVDTSFITGVEFQNHATKIFLVELFGECQNGGSFSGSWGAVEK